MVKVQLFKSKTHLSEIFQSLDIKFAHVSQDPLTGVLKQIHLEGKCRDFLGDVIWAKLTKNNVNIYNFQYSFVNGFETDKDNTLLTMKFPDEQSYKTFTKRLYLLNKLETKYGIEHTKYEETDTKNQLLIIADKDYSSSVWKISWFTFWLKFFSYKTKKELSKPEDTYYTHLTLAVRKAFWSKIKVDTPEVLADGIYTAHNHSGFMSVLKKDNPNHNLIFGAK